MRFEFPSCVPYSEHGAITRIRRKSILSTLAPETANLMFGVCFQWSAVSSTHLAKDDVAGSMAYAGPLNPCTSAMLTNGI